MLTLLTIVQIFSTLFRSFQFLIVRNVKKFNEKFRFHQKILWYRIARVYSPNKWKQFSIAFVRPIAMNERVYEELALNGLQLRLIGWTMKNENTKNQIQSNSVLYSNTIHLSSPEMYCKSDWVPESESISVWSELSL